MRLTLRLLGLTVLDVEASTEDQVEVTEGAELAGGTTSAYPIDAGVTDRFMGFTNGREVEE